MKILDLFKVKVYYFCSYKANKEDKIITGSCLVDYSRYFWKKQILKLFIILFLIK